jgi:hypothetical protein
MVMTYISSDVPEHKNQEYVWFRIGIWTQTLGHSLFKGGQDHPL